MKTPEHFHLATMDQKKIIQSRKEKFAMNTQLRTLRYALVAVGLIFTLGIYPLTILWPDGWTWHTGHSDYIWMILGVYATLGIFLLMAARNPHEHASLIWFTVWSSVVHAIVMAAEAIAQPMHAGHLLGDVPALLLVAGLLAVLMLRHAPVPTNLAASAKV
jgi:FtsH-binding integral membrane protein